jgi:hypothetical protein
MPGAFQSRGVTEPQRERATKWQGDSSTEEGSFAVGSELDAAKKIAQLPTSMQAKYSNLPRTAQRALIK